jgi:beta-mannosidase
VIVPLDGDWRLELAGSAMSGRSDWTAAVPGGVHEALIASGTLPHPYLDYAAAAGRWVEEREWRFKRTLSGLGTRAPGERDFLVFERLDGRASVLLGGEALATHHSTFVPLELDVTGRVDADSTLEVVFEPIAAGWAGRHIEMPWGWYAPEERVWVRKPQAQFCWDHCPRYVNVGIGSVRIERRLDARLRRPWVRVLAADAGQAVVAFQVDVEAWGESAGGAMTGLTVEVELLDATGRQVAAAMAPVRDGAARAVLTVDRPRRWFPNGIGPSPLYRLRAGLVCGGAALDTWEHAVGLRTLVLRREPQPEEPGCESFTFVVNGVPVFAKGADWVPPSLFASKPDDAGRVESLELLAETGANMIRNWGGGDFETDAFHDACDRLGILVWQDAMFSCARYPDDDPEFLALATAENEHHIARLRNHPSTAVLCGSNENEWHEDTHVPADPGHEFPGSRLYREVLPALVERLAPDMPYWPCSPYGGDDHNSEFAGDRHNWSTWHGMPMRRRFGEDCVNGQTSEAVGYRHLGEDRARFLSEFGVHAIPSLRTLRRYVAAEGLELGSPAMLDRDKNEVKGRLDLVLDAHAPARADLDDQIFWSQLVQAEALTLGIETARTRMWSCSGALFWQWNDCWPAISWSVVDIDLRLKAGWWAARRAFAPVLACAIVDGDDVAVFLVNDTPAPVAHEVEWSLLGFDGRRVAGRTAHVAVPASTARLVDRVPGVAGDPDLRRCALVAVSLDGASAGRTLLAELKDLARTRPAVTVTWEVDGGGAIATLASDGHALGVHLEADDPAVHAEDNWFDLVPGHPRRILVTHRHGGTVDPAQIEVAWR